MPRLLFEKELQKLQDRLLALGSTVEENIAEVVEVLRKRSTDGSWRLISGDRWVNEQRITIMNEALLLIATQQPMAGDMRFIASVIEIAGELERINDYVKGIARINLLIDRETQIEHLLVEMPEMVAVCRRMLRRALDAFSKRDAAAARQIPQLDDQVDELFNQTYARLIDYVGENPALLQKVSYLEWGAHNLERAADRVINICEWVVYTVEGSYVEMDSELEAPPPQAYTPNPLT